MTRDLDLIRRILADVEALPAGDWLVSPSYPTEYDDATVQAHVILLKDAGLIEADVTEFMMGGAHIQIHRLTWAGHDFVQAAMDSSVWAQAKEKIKNTSSSISFDLFLELLKALARDQLGL